MSINTKQHLKALPSHYYTDQNIAREEQEKLFFRTWQYACHISELESPGAYVTTEILGQNVFVIRNTQNEIKAFYNVCPHRGHKLLEGRGEKKVIVCPYHQWSYSLDGNLRQNRSTSSSEVPSKSEICLYSVRVDRLLDFVFINLDPEAEPISEFWPGLENHVLETCPDLAGYELSDKVSALHPVDLQANWKIHVDNFLECYHCRIGHESFSDMLDITRQKQTLHKNYSYVYIPSSGKLENKAYPLHSDFDDKDLLNQHLDHKN